MMFVSVELFQFYRGKVFFCFCKISKERFPSRKRYAIFEEKYINDYIKVRRKIITTDISVNEDI